MPRKRKPPLNAQALHPSRIVDLGRVGPDWQGHLWAALTLPGIPPGQVVEVAQAVSLAILKVLKWPDDQAAIVAEKVREDIAYKLHMATTHDPEALGPQPQKPHPDLSMDDGIPF